MWKHVKTCIKPNKALQVRNCEAYPSWSREKAGPSCQQSDKYIASLRISILEKQIYHILHYKQTKLKISELKKPTRISKTDHWVPFKAPVPCHLVLPSFFHRFVVLTKVTFSDGNNGPKSRSLTLHDVDHSQVRFQVIDMCFRIQKEVLYISDSRSKWKRKTMKDVGFDHWSRRRLIINLNW